MKNIFYLLSTVVVFFGIVTAQVPQLITHQGYLVDSTGQGVNATLPMTFRFFADSTGGTALLTQTFSNVQVMKGAYTIVLNVTSLSFSSQQWIETDVNSETLSPRTRLTSVPYSLQAMSLIGPGSLATGTDAIAGGTNNRARGNYSVVGGGGGGNVSDSNSAIGDYSTVGGGSDNQSSGHSATIGGGINNSADNFASTVSGGRSNAASGLESTVGGGSFNKARGSFSVVCGGGNDFETDSNSALGNFSVVPGGTRNKAAGNYSFAAGRRAKANHEGTFVWGDATNADFASTASNQFLIRASGGVGIGTGTPNAQLGIKYNSTHETSPHILLTEDADDYARLDYKNTASTNFWSLAGYPNVADASSSFNFYYGGTSKDANLMSLNGNGYASFYAGLNVDVVNANTGSVNPGITFGLGSGEGMSSKRTAGGNQYGLDLYTSSTARLSISSGGNVGVGINNPGNILTIQQSSATDPIADAWTTYSSRRWKENIKPLEGALEKVGKLQGVSYDWKETGKHDIGLIAEEVGKVIPEVVAYEENGVDAKSVDYPRLVAVLIEGMKQQQREIEELRMVVNSLVSKETENK